MRHAALYPLRFEPIFKPAIWGGRKLPAFLGRPAPDGPVGEAWVLSDVKGSSSVVADGPLAGAPLHDLMADVGGRLLGWHPADGRFPLLLKFLDAREHLSVQVHPDDAQAVELTGDPNARGKTEAWVVLESEPHGRLFAGLRPGVGADAFKSALVGGTVADVLHAYAPKPGDCVLLKAGTVHAIGGGLMLFEVQQTSDITFRLHDWGRVDARTGKPRELHVPEALYCTDYARGPCDPLPPAREPHGCEQLADCDYFTMWRRAGAQPFAVGGTSACRVVVGLEGRADLTHGLDRYAIGPGTVLLIPAEVGACVVVPRGPATVLECSPRPEAASRRGASAA
jgi:mannose-6-phosphate isomerase